MPIYHGSPIHGLKTIEKRISTQKDSFVYGTDNMLYAVMFGAMKLCYDVSPIIPLAKFSKPTLIERFPYSLDYLKGKQLSVYVLNENNFNSFDNHSAGDSIEKRASGDQNVVKEIVIDDVYEYMKNNGVNLVNFENRQEYGIPEDFKYVIQGVMKTYLWKIEDKTEENIINAKNHIEMYKKGLPQYSELLDKLVNIVDGMDIDEAKEFVNQIYDKNINEFNEELINSKINNRTR